MAPPPLPPFLRHFGALETCSDLQHPRITCIILSNLFHFSQLVLSTQPFLFYQLLPYNRTYAILSFFSSSRHLVTFVVLRYLRTQYMYLLYTPKTQLSLPSHRAHALFANTLLPNNRHLWPSCHSDMGVSRYGRTLRSLWTPRPVILFLPVIQGSLGKGANEVRPRQG